MPARYLESNPCEDACGTLQTDERIDGAPVYLCPGCDSRWYELGERTSQDALANQSASARRSGGAGRVQAS